MAGGGFACAIPRGQMIPISKAAKSFAEQVNRAIKGEEVFIVKHNDVKAVLMGMEEYEHLCHMAEIAERINIAQLVEERKDADRSKDVDLEEFLRERGL